MTLTVAGLAMGMMIFIMASGLTLVFGLMDVLNFGHGAFIALGAYVAAERCSPLAGLVQAEFAVRSTSPRWLSRCSSLRWSCGGARAASSSACIIRRSTASTCKQILITIGGLIVAEQLLYALLGPRADSAAAAGDASAAPSSSATSRSRSTALLAVVVGLVGVRRACSWC